MNLNKFGLYIYGGSQIDIVYIYVPAFWGAFLQNYQSTTGTATNDFGESNTPPPEFRNYEKT